MKHSNLLRFYFLLFLFFSITAIPIKTQAQAFEFTGLDTDYCSNNTAVTLTGSEAPQGFFSGPGITDGGNGTAIFDPATAATGGTVNYNLDASWQSVSGGNRYSLGIQADGSLWAWGDNFYGQLGNGNNTNSNTPVQVGNNTNWISISGGSHHSLGTQADGSLWAWGDNFYGQLGNGNNTNSNTPVQIGVATSWLSVSGGSVHSLGIQADGSLWAWGRNFYGQLGNGNNTNSNTPVQVGTNTNWIHISGGNLHSLGIQADGSLWAWGNNFYSQLGNGSTGTDVNSPVQIGSNTNWISVVAGSAHNLGIQADGSLWTWGNNFYGQLGNGSTGTDANSPIQVGSNTNWINFTADFNHSLGIQADGSLWAWGYNLNGQLGNGNTGTNSNIPVQIGSNTNWQSISEGASHSLAIQSDGSLWTWGWNFAGQLGNGNTGTDSNIPLQVSSSQVYEQIVNVAVCNSVVSIDISDPCSCGNPLNVLDNSSEVVLFHETVSITASTGQTWNLTGINSGSALDASGVPLVLPAALTETPAGSGTYEIEFYHTPAVGYNATFSNGTAADDQIIGNSCSACPPIPTMSQWGLMILGLLFLTFSSLFAMQQSGIGSFKLASTNATSIKQFINIKKLPFNKKLYFQILVFVLLCFVLLFTTAMHLFGYELTTSDIPGSLIFSSILAYFMSLFFVETEK